MEYVRRLPLAYKVSLAYVGFIAMELNFDVINTNIPLEIMLMLIALSFFAPLIIAFSPIRNSVTMTVKNALNTNRLRRSTEKVSTLRTSRIPLWLKMTLENLFKNKKRLTISVFNLGLGIALIFIAFNVSNSLKNTFAKSAEREKQDLSIILDKTYNEQEVLNAFGKDSNIAEVEFWERGRAFFIFKDSIKGQSFSTVSFQDNTKLLDLSAIEGEIPENWTNAIVVNTEFLGAFPKCFVGDSILLFSGDKYTQVYISGVVKIIGVPTAYFSKSASKNLIVKNIGLTELKIKLADNIHSTTHSEKITQYENRLAKNQIYAINSKSMAETIQVLEDHIFIILYFLIAMSFLVLLVGGLGVVSVMNINIMERKREIGVMRAIGGKPFQVQIIIIVEMLLFGILSWLIFWLISIPISKIISDFFGQLIIETDLDYTFEPKAIPITFITMIFVILFALIFPLRKTKKISVKDAIMHE